MSLDVHVRNILDQMAQLKLPKFSEIGPQAARAAMRSSIFRGGDTPIGKVEDANSRPRRRHRHPLYTPVGAARRPGGLVFYHGGGFVIGDLRPMTTCAAASPTKAAAASSRSTTASRPNTRSPPPSTIASPRRNGSAPTPPSSASIPRV